MKVHVLLIGGLLGGLIATAIVEIGYVSYLDSMLQAKSSNPACITAIKQ